MRTPVINAKRIILRPFCNNDLEDVFYGWENDPDVARYMYWQSHNDINKTKAWLKKEVSKIDSHDWYRWAIVCKDNGKVIGTCLIYFEEEYNEFEISYNLSKRTWRCGYTTEAMTAVIKFAKENLHLKKIIGHCAKVNKASANVMKKLGFKFVRNMPYKCNDDEEPYEGEEYILEID